MWSHFEIVSRQQRAERAEQLAIMTLAARGDGKEIDRLIRDWNED